MTDQHWHRLVPSDFEKAHADALREYESRLVAALGTRLPWSDEREAAFRYAVEAVFDAGYRACREHDIHTEATNAR